MPIDARAPYDASNIFARILRGEIPCRKVYEDDFALAFHDINPLAPVHVLVIPKGDFVSMADFTEHADSATIAGFWRAVGAVTRTLDLVGAGYRLLSNVGLNAGQEVPHMHVHIFAGQPLGGMLPPAE
jgi:histidine triad (HIT) family protein